MSCVSINLNWHCKAKEPSGRWKNECQQSLLTGQGQEVPAEEWLIMTHPLPARFRKGWKIWLLWLTLWYPLWMEGQLLNYILVIRWESEVKMCFPWQQAELATADFVPLDESSPHHEHILLCVWWLYKQALFIISRSLMNRGTWFCLQLIINILSFPISFLCSEVLSRAFKWWSWFVIVPAAMNHFNCWCVWRGDWCGKEFRAVNYCTSNISISYITLHTKAHQISLV